MDVQSVSLEGLREAAEAYLVYVIPHKLRRGPDVAGCRRDVTVHGQHSFQPFILIVLPHITWCRASNFRC
eukprot:9494238-Pyramimonas_sp.AAC.1